MSKPGAPVEKKEFTTPSSSPKPETSGKKKHEAAPGACASVSCKSTPHRFNFCDEHYEQFKFGLIKKTGEPVPDYEKKFGHYEAYKAKQTSVRKAA